MKLMMMKKVNQQNVLSFLPRGAILARYMP